MAKFRLSADLLKALIPVAIPIAEDLAARTTTKLDDKAVAAVKLALSNPFILAYLLAMLDDTQVPPAVIPVEDQPAVSALDAQADQVRALFALVA